MQIVKVLRRLPAVYASKAKTTSRAIAIVQCNWLLKHTSGLLTQL